MYSIYSASLKRPKTAKNDARQQLCNTVQVYLAVMHPSGCQKLFIIHHEVSLVRARRYQEYLKPFVVQKGCYSEIYRLGECLEALDILEEASVLQSIFLK